jgi:hypothetical protein
MALTESEITAILTEYQNARTAILAGGQSYTINTGGTNRMVTMADLEFVERMIGEYQQMLDELNDELGWQAGAGW